jgi:hypothetical protein
MYKCCYTRLTALARILLVLSSKQILQGPDDSTDAGFKAFVQRPVFTFCLLLGFGPRANYTNRATAACRRN